MKVDIKIDEYGFGILDFGGMKCAVMPMYQLPIEMHERVEIGSINAKN